MIYFTSDTHYFHKNVITYCNRPYESLEQMHEKLIENYNSVVGPNDECYILGDFSFGNAGNTEEIVKRLNGKKHLILGNHDGHSATRYKAMGFESVVNNQKFCHVLGEDTEPTEHSKQEIQLFNMSHFPYLEIESGYEPELLDELKIKYKYHKFGVPNDGKWLLHGHVHCSWKTKGMMINVGVDVWDFKPVSMEQIMEIVKKMKKTKVIIRMHFLKDDKSCGGDYNDVEVIVDGKLAVQYGDHYHDKGTEKAEGFVDGLIFAGLNPEVKDERVADRDE